MQYKITVWRVDPDNVFEVSTSSTRYENELEEILASNPEILGDDIAIIGRQVGTDFGPLDLLAINEDGDLVVIELKRDQPPRNVISQVLEYGAWVSKLTEDEIERILLKYYEGKYGSLENFILERFNKKIDDIDININQRYIIISRRWNKRFLDVIEYLRSFGINIDIFLYTHFKINDANYISFLRITKEEVSLSLKDLKKREDVKLIIDKKIQDKGLKNLFDCVEKSLKNSNLSEIFRLVPAKSLYEISEKENNKVIVRINIDESNKERGLKFQLYTRRLSDLLVMDLETLKKDILPSNINNWQYARTKEEYQGNEWFFNDCKQIKEFFDKISKVLNNNY